MTVCYTAFGAFLLNVSLKWQHQETNTWRECHTGIASSTGLLLGGFLFMSLFLVFSLTLTLSLFRIPFTIYLLDCCLFRNGVYRVSIYMLLFISTDINEWTSFRSPFAIHLSPTEPFVCVTFWWYILCVVEGVWKSERERVSKIR